MPKCFPHTLLQVAEVTAVPADSSAEALSLAVALESSGLVHFVVRRAAEGENALASRDHTIVYKGTREVNGTSSSSSPPQQLVPPGGGTAGLGVAKAAGAVSETVEGLEPNATYEVQQARGILPFSLLFLFRDYNMSSPNSVVVRRERTVQRNSCTSFRGSMFLAPPMFFRGLRAEGVSSVFLVCGVHSRGGG